MNRVILSGRVGKDPELRKAQNNSVLDFTMATSERYLDRLGDKQERTEWHKIVIWGKRADALNQYIKKGMLIVVTGKLKTDTWEKDGVKKSRTYIVANDIEFYNTQKAGQKKPVESNDEPPFSDEDHWPI